MYGENYFNFMIGGLLKCFVIAMMIVMFVELICFIVKTFRLNKKLKNEIELKNKKIELKNDAIFELMNGNVFVKENDDLKQQINFLIRDANEERAVMQRKINQVKKEKRKLLEKNVKLQKELAYRNHNMKGARK